MCIYVRESEKMEEPSYISVVIRKSVQKRQRAFKHSYFFMYSKIRVYHANLCTFST
jgi:hypothetical protein